ncbi:BREX-1 system adenine-specific DNA-methyltransferase PglX [Bacillus sp. es.034]|uniref:BREX-1 system adenine-specific DNA-methyltransferase PglX n=1 Tax=Bacillus sp. es.034 TaxID=1761763 RepID=UPI000BF4F154|nr:BREX-1 system adenine-specific DNA-methyltransferase PglX [Bacillus sp. es.034]PFG07776.1 N-6 DNA methylase [Bacillus sp. es.034]
MNKTELKNFAIQSRRQLIDQVKTKALLYGIDEKNDLEIHEEFGQIMINHKSYPLYMKPAFDSLKNQLRQKGYKRLVEEVAYTWFNRIIAIRFMEVHDYLPEKVSVLSSSVGRVDPDILFEYETMELPIKPEEIRALLHAGDTEGAFRKLFIAQCNALNSILPFLFEQIQNYTELLLPDFLLDAESVIKVLVKNDELTNSFEEIEVIGWLYQYYIAEEKDRVFAQKSKYKKEEIPFATQLFTPKWIVQYMVQNSLGRYWTEAHREDEDLISNWEYFIKHEEEDFQEKIASFVNKELRVEDIKLLDPAMGSGHILVYAFEVFQQIYEKCGYPEREIPRLIIENNLYGLDIDDRAYQLAAFAVVMKAAAYSRRFLRSVEREGIQFNLVSIQETNHISDSVIAYVAQEEEGERYKKVKAFFDQYHNAKTYGSLINITERDIIFIEERLEHIQINPVEDLFYSEQHDTAKELLPELIQQTKIMRNEYDVIVMNPPYLGTKKLSKEFNAYLKAYYPNSKADLFAAFMEINHLLKGNGFYSAINQTSWMFLTSYEKLRKEIISNRTIYNLVHLGARAFEEINGEVVQSTTFVLRNINIEEFNGIYVRLVESETALQKQKEFNSAKRYKFEQENFMKLPGSPISYWISENIRNAFLKFDNILDVGDPKQGMATSDNDRFLKRWFEVDFYKVGFNIKSNEESLKSKNRWFPYNKGGSYRKWFGNNEFVVDWEENGKRVLDYATELYKSPTRTIKNISSYFKEGLTWSDLTTGGFSARYVPNGFIFDTAGPTMFLHDEKDKYMVLGYINSIVFQNFLNLSLSGLHYNNGVIKSLPYKKINKFEVENLVKENIFISKSEWDMKEVSWDFKKHPLLSGEAYIGDSFQRTESEIRTFIDKLCENEFLLNHFFINEFDLEKDIFNDRKAIKSSIKNMNKEDAVKSFLSYYIGCLLGRYSIDIDGLVYAGGEWSDSKFTSFKPNLNGFVHFTESAYFEQDIILRLREFLAVVFSPDTVEENMQWLGDSLEMKNGEDAETRLRRYFIDEFFIDHCKVYQKRPIYWLVDSGKQKGLRTIIYMHRYQPGTMATIRFEHLQEIQTKYQNEITDLENRLVNPNLSASEKKKLTAVKTSFEKKMDELREFDKRLAEIANEEIEIDLDDGVKVNYEKFYRGGKGVLAKIK